MKQEIQQHDYCQKAISFKKDLEKGFLVLAEHLYEIKEKELWRASWASWLEFTWELKMSQNTIFKLLQIYKKLVLDYGLKMEFVVTAGGWSVVADLLPVMQDKKSAMKWLLKAQDLTRSDLRKELKEEQAGIPSGQCQHKIVKLVEICDGCGHIIKYL